MSEKHTSRFFFGIVFATYNREHKSLFTTPNPKMSGSKLSNSGASERKSGCVKFVIGSCIFLFFSVIIFRIIEWASKSFLNSTLVVLSSITIFYVSRNIYNLYKNERIKRAYLKAIAYIKRKGTYAFTLKTDKYDYLNVKYIVALLAALLIISLPAIKGLLEEDMEDRREEQINRHEKLNNRVVDYTFSSVEEFERRYRRDDDCPDIGIEWKDCKYVPSRIKISGVIRDIEREKEDCGDFLDICVDEGHMKNGDDFILFMKFAFPRYFKLFGGYDKKDGTVICKLRKSNYYPKSGKVAFNLRTCSII